ncbi:MAG: IS30 family transposase [Balneolaceae bacterium]|nr:IS30 family transposase [Balneolaceae bacterium]
MTGKAHQSHRSCKVHTRLKKGTSRQADHTETAIEQMLGKIPKAFIKTLTLDNDKAFANHQAITGKLDADVYFTHPYISQDKGTVENRIGVIRQFFPKGTDLREVSEQRIKTAERHINNRAIRKLIIFHPFNKP